MFFFFTQCAMSSSLNRSRNAPPLLLISIGIRNKTMGMWVGSSGGLNDYRSDGIPEL